VSLLFALYQMASGGGPSFVFGIKDASQDARPVGGMGAICRAVTAELRDAVHLRQPVRCITADDDGVTVRCNDITVRALRVIVAVPLAIAGQIVYEPMLPVERSFLHQRMPTGSIIKTSIIYDELFWRADGMSGQSAAPGSPATVTIDACTDTGRPGVLCVIAEGPVARYLSNADEADRRAAVLEDLVERFGMISHAPPGVLTQFGPALRPHCGRVHWAGTESSAVMCGWVDGAIRSGERAAAEVMQRERVAVA
jgi:monoamine oxidase